MVEKDKNIARDIRIGNIHVFEKLFRDYYNVLCNYANRYVKDIDWAEEIVQDLFVKIWEKRDDFNITTSLESYLFKSVYNNSLQHLKHRRAIKKYEEHYKTGNKETLDTNNIPGQIVSQELYLIVDKTLSSLPEKCSRIFKLNRFEGLKYREIAEKLSLSVKTVEANMGKALKEFRKNLSIYTGFY